MSGSLLGFVALGWDQKIKFTRVSENRFSGPTWPIPTTPPPLIQHVETVRFINIVIIIKLDDGMPNGISRMTPRFALFETLGII